MRIQSSAKSPEDRRRGRGRHEGVVETGISRQYNRFEWLAVRSVDDGISDLDSRSGTTLNDWRKS